MPSLNFQCSELAGFLYLSLDSQLAEPSRGIQSADSVCKPSNLRYNEQLGYLSQGNEKKVLQWWGNTLKKHKRSC